MAGGAPALQFAPVTDFGDAEPVGDLAALRAGVPDVAAVFVEIAGIVVAFDDPEDALAEVAVAESLMGLSEQGGADSVAVAPLAGLTWCGSTLE